jgi:hypothetical protein
MLHRHDIALAERHARRAPLLAFKTITTRTGKQVEPPSPASDRKRRRHIRRVFISLSRDRVRFRGVDMVN